MFRKARRKAKGLEAQAKLAVYQKIGKLPKNSRELYRAIRKAKL